MRFRVVATSFLFLISFKMKAQLAGLVISGNPADTTNGATWKYNAIIDSITYNLEGILFTPDTNFIHSAIIINHGTGNNAYSFPKVLAKKFVSEGFVCIAVNYTHSSGVPCGSPGDCNDMMQWGASPENILRGMKCWDILASLSYVDSTCIMTYGTSRGSFVTTALVANYPHQFRAACHVAGGTSNDSTTTAPNLYTASLVTVPYEIHHGDSDTTVPLYADLLFDSILNSDGCVHQMYIYHGEDHFQTIHDSLQLQRTIQWFQSYSCNVTSTQNLDPRNITVFPNPTSGEINISLPPTQSLDIKFYNSLGCLVEEKHTTHFSIDEWPTGLYFVTIQTDNQFYSKRIVKQ